VFFQHVYLVIVCVWICFAGLSEYQTYMLPTLKMLLFLALTYQFAPPQKLLYLWEGSLSLFVYCLCLSGRDHITNHGSRYSSVVLVSTFEHTRLFGPGRVSYPMTEHFIHIFLISSLLHFEWFKMLVVVMGALANLSSSIRLWTVEAN